MFFYTVMIGFGIKKVTNGLDVVYDSVGSTLAESFGATKVGGTVVFYGMAGEDPFRVDPRMPWILRKH